MKKNETPKTLDSEALNFCLKSRYAPIEPRRKTKSELVCAAAGHALCWLFIVGFFVVAAMILLDV